MSECEGSSDGDTMDSCDGPIVMVGDKNTLNYSPCSVEVDFETESPSSEAEHQLLLDGKKSQLKTEMNFKLDEEADLISSGHKDNIPNDTSAKRPDDLECKDVSGGEDHDGNGNPDPETSPAEMLVAETADEGKDRETTATSVVSNIAKTDKTKTDHISIKATGEEEYDNDVPMEDEYCNDETESTDEEYLNQNPRPIYMVGQSNIINININGRTERMITMEGNTKVRIEYTAKMKAGNTVSSQENPSIKIIIEEDAAEDAAFRALHRKPVRTTLDTMFDAITFIVDSILPGSIVIEIKPTSEHSVRTLLESMTNGKLDNIIKEILNQESVFKHIRGKEVTVKVELEIPEELLQKEGIVVIGDPQSEISVTLKEQDCDDSSQSSSVDPPDILSADDCISSSVDPVSEKPPTVAVPQTGPEIAESSSFSHLILPTLSKRCATQSSIRQKHTLHKKLTVDALEEMVSMDSTEILMRLNKQKKDLKDILTYKNLKRKGIHITLVLLGKVVQCDSMTEWVNELLSTIVLTPFLWDTCSYFLGQLDDDATELKETITNILPILRSVLQKMPTDGWSRVQHIAFLIQGKWQRSKQTDTSVTKDIDNLFELIHVTKPQASAFIGEREEHCDDFETPPESFRKLPIIPRKEELDGSVDIFLLSNKVGKRFNDLDHYLECQFRLFRADVILPLKQNIQDFKNFRESGTTPFRVYSEVQIIRPVCSENGLGYRIAFDPKPLRRIKWDTSQRLIFGSLLCLSSDKFVDSMLFATVDNRETERLNKGLVDVQFLCEDFDITTLSRDLRFDMVESPAYFESYKDVLKGMQSLTDRNLPFEEYIVECQNVVNEPAYLQKDKNAIYDLIPLLDHDFKVRDDNRAFPLETDAALSINIREKSLWPDIDDLDRSQLIAVQNALTREFALIHGPPGTGKTYVGITILKILLHNSRLWLQGQSGIPILIVCYTNHALDQFLEGLLSTFEGKLIRVGGRIKSELLKKYSLKNARQNIKEKKAIPRHLHEAEMVTRRAMNTLKKDIHKIADKIEVAEREIVHEHLLKDVMNKRLANSFTERPSISRWLGVEKKITDLESERQVPPHTSLQMESVEDESDDETDTSIDESDVSENRYQRRLEEDTMDIFSDSDSDDQVGAAGGLHSNDFKTYIAVSITTLDDYNKPQFIPKSQRRSYMEKMKRKSRLKTQLLKEVTSTDKMTDQEENRIKDIWKLKVKDKWRLYRFWVDLLVKKARVEIKTKEDEYRRTAAKFKEILAQEDRIILQSCSVIGMTTTGAARYQKVLNDIGPKIIVVEEAAEVLEAHIIGTLSKKCQHLVLIGDHMQLRPNPTVHELAKKYNLEISLFERMIKSGINCDMLEWQHRMRPEIADTIRSLYQGQLKDHELVTCYGNVKGIASNVYFIEHQHQHLFDEETKSFQNDHEAAYLAALCRYLLKQGYEKSQVTILTFYSAQLQCIKRKMSELNGVRLAAVDGYQGEENDIILLSLVRSKTEGTIGFLREENRICVALSRAKIGMYVIGNISHIVQHSELMKEICQKAHDQGKLGPALPLCCQRHPSDNPVGAIEPTDFETAPEGGCSKPCDYRLPCGHVCPKLCHANDPEHKDYKCTKQCRKTCKNGHSTCKEMCYKQCPPCQESIQVTLPKCGHTESVPCHVDPSEYQCTEKCPEILPCGHRCSGLCGAPHPLCTDSVEVDLTCGHRSPVPCGDRDISSCTRPCDTILECEHTCQGTCGGCHQGRLHEPCMSKCTQILICGHECQSSCSNYACPPCEKPCGNKCSHAKCRHKCGDPCVTCKEPCELRCRHSKCKSLCGDACDKKRCNDICKKKLQCGHPCLGLCGEKCPSLCRVCNKEEVTEILSLFGTEAKQNNKFIQLEDCGHKFEVFSLDKWMDEAAEDENKAIVKLKECPKCRMPVRSSLRYANVIKQALSDIEKAKLKVKGNEKRVDELKQKREKLIRQFSGHDRRITEQLIKVDLVPSENLLSTQATQLGLLHHVSSIEKKMKMRDETTLEPEQRHNSLERYIRDFKKWILISRSSFSKQEMADSRREIDRLSLLRFIVNAKHLIETDKIEVKPGMMDRLSLLIQKMESSCLMTESDFHDAGILREEVKKFVPESKIGVSEEERLMIVEAVGLKRGHWYKCKEGHVYAIGECGRAFEEATCPECGGAIGGMSHQLSEDNAWAPEMDDAEEFPWSEESDLEYAKMLDKELNG